MQLSTPFTLLLSFTTLIASQSIDPSTIPLATRENWCSLQKASCPLLCPQIGGSNVPRSNTCDAASLAYSCVCSNGQQPNASQYTQTIPYFECTEAANQCVARCTSSDSACVTQCRTVRPCGAQDPPRRNRTATLTAAAVTSSGTAAATGFGGPGSGGGSGSGSTAAAPLRDGSITAMLLMAGLAVASYAYL